MQTQGLTQFCSAAANVLEEKPNRPSQSKVLCSDKAIAANEIELILQVLHAETKEDFRNAIAYFLTEEEFEIIAAAENNSLFIQAARIFDGVIRRISLRLAELVGFSQTALADVIEPRTHIKADFSCLVLDINSRNLKGPVAFRVSEPANITGRFPAAALNLLEETRCLWKRVVYIEPLYDRQGKILRSVREVKNVYAKPKDPVICGYAGCGVRGYGYNLPFNFLKKHSQIKAQDGKTRDTAFLIAHWD